MSKVYIVEGATGEYADHRDWVVAAYHNEQLAKEHTDKANARVKELGCHRDSENSREVYYGDDDNHPIRTQNEWDPKMQVDYAGTRYYYYGLKVSRTIQAAIKTAEAGIHTGG